MGRKLTKDLDSASSPFQLQDPNSASTSTRKGGRELQEDLEQQLNNSLGEHVSADVPIGQDLES